MILTWEAVVGIVTLTCAVVAALLFIIRGMIGNALTRFKDELLAELNDKDRGFVRRHDCEMIHRLSDQELKSDIKILGQQTDDLRHEFSGLQTKLERAFAVRLENGN